LFNCSCTGDGPRHAVSLCYHGAARHGVRLDPEYAPGACVLVIKQLTVSLSSQLHRPPPFVASYCSLLSYHDRAHASHLVPAAWSFRALRKEGYDAVMRAFDANAWARGWAPSRWPGGRKMHTSISNCSNTPGGGPLVGKRRGSTRCMPRISVLMHVQRPRARRASVQESHCVAQRGKPSCLLNVHGGC
jgi:hypothetical protein